MYLILGLFILPFVYWPWAQVAYEIPRVEFVLRWVELGGIMAVFWFLTRKVNQVRTRSVVNLLLLLGSLLISALISVDPVKSWWGNYFRGDGLFTTIHLAVFSLLVSLFARREGRIWLSRAVAGGSALASIWAVYWGLRLHVLADQTVPNWQGKIGISFGQPVFLAGYLVVTLPFIWYLWRVSRFKWEKIIWMIMFVGQSLAIFFTGSWGGIVVFFIFGLLGYTRELRLGFREAVLGMTIACLLALGMFGYKWWSVSRIPPQVLAESRQRIFVKGLLAWTQKPVWGWGPANFDYAFTAVDWPYRFTHDAYIDKAHSELLEILVTGGVMGGGLYISLIFLAVSNLWFQQKLAQARDREWWMSILFMLIMYTIHSQTNVVGIGEQVMFWLGIGLSAQEF